jgi:hypothetical protein
MAARVRLIQKEIQLSRQRLKTVKKNIESNLKKID